MLTYQIFKACKISKYLPRQVLKPEDDAVSQGSGLILDMLQMLFGYRHYDYRKCPTSFKSLFFYIRMVHNAGAARDLIWLWIT